jgi:hypothetical protein
MAGQFDQEKAKGLVLEVRRSKPNDDNRYCVVEFLAQIGDALGVLKFFAPKDRLHAYAHVRAGDVVEADTQQTRKGHGTFTDPTDIRVIPGAKASLIIK